MKWFILGFIGAMAADLQLLAEQQRTRAIDEQCNARLTACIESKYARPKVCK